MTTPVTYSGEGLRITVNDMIHDPHLVSSRMLSMMENQFIMESILRNAGTNNSGVIRYNQETPLFADDDPEVVAEGAEIPLGVGREGIPKAAYTVKTALGIEITREARDRNRVDLVDKRMNQVRNTFLRHWERRLFALLKASVPTTAALNPWISSVTIRDDISTAIEAVTEATAGNVTDDYLGFTPNIMVLPQQIAYDMMRNNEWARLYELGEKLVDHPQYEHRLERSIQGMTVLISRFLKPADGAFIMERNTVGGWSDERPMSSSALYEDQNRETWRTNVVRRTALFIDEPKAAIRVTGV
jgi:hypothetical protein